MSWILGIDTASVEFGIGLYNDSTAVAGYSRYVRNSHAEYIHRNIQFLLDSEGIAPEDIGHIGIDIGPGSFTGLRIGIAFVKGFCCGRTIPVFPVSSLECMANTRRGYPSEIVVGIDARRDEVYWAKFRAEGADKAVTRITGDTLGHVDTFTRAIGPETVVITDCQGYRKSTVFSFLESHAYHCPVERVPFQRGITCTWLASRARKETNEWYDARQIEPRYLRHSYAEEKRGLS
jgi:tRNA threonylcarbamoyl adenosine modification protein YeaZ